MGEKRTGTCHCRAVTFEVELENGLEGVRRCNCSLCRRKGAVMAMVPLDRLVVLQGEDKLSLYQWNTKKALLRKAYVSRCPDARDRPPVYASSS